MTFLPLLNTAIVFKLKANCKIAKNFIVQGTQKFGAKILQKKKSKAK